MYTNNRDTHELANEIETEIKLNVKLDNCWPGTPHFILCHSRQVGWEMAERMSKVLSLPGGAPVTVPYVSTIPEAIQLLQGLTTHPVVVFAPAVVFLFPGWACPLDLPTKLHATFPMHDEETAQFMGRFNRLNPRTGNIGDNLSVGKIVRFSDIAC
ncbi:hypothetical protein Nazgul24 [Burkholderia phage BcepNazgul]|uniref:Uncharacterized protein n=1 Tax=Burkholderia phage BcepNazgul TaxID=242861 RepID=Q6UYL6_9CAUD|nr:hypothetical protein Nazgul24 [Burkholderia phage BcepNazgul]AAQ63325.1 hypothetical protein Nazgul24 [Burkholderia phage BcepNazgul]